MVYERFDFGEAIRQLKSGRAVAREGWNGRGMWIRLRTGRRRMPAEPFKLLPYVEMKTADDSMVPWLCSQTDMLAEDWTVVDATYSVEELGDDSIDPELR